MGIALRRGEAGVSQQLLDGAEVPTTGEEVGREAVPELVRADAAIQPDLTDALRDRAPDGPIREPRSSGVHQKGFAPTDLLPLLEVGPDREQSGTAGQHQRA